MGKDREPVDQQHHPPPATPPVPSQHSREIPKCRLHEFACQLEFKRRLRPSLGVLFRGQILPDNTHHYCRRSRTILRLPPTPP
uniref:Uncharacterized protein n=1 Tax=Caenorhabditis japonica TaxID=281687 RepID=A0A8R1IBE2_CAEJA